MIKMRKLYYKQKQNNEKVSNSFFILSCFNIHFWTICIGYTIRKFV
ncbi:hypothetical protein HMPREF9141_2544 [Prevotella multiformis DSM 16608]|uniref:Uncharacterized protein n=1 Tax=Prevotella multiformis DSM 16608 TaxID=888743 RepID=F0FAC7_9BACT|nr:hypothetical protein HMPREF9141_2544 [Prevotella multiformis DSM 16608]